MQAGIQKAGLAFLSLALIIGIAAGKAGADTYNVDIQGEIDFGEGDLYDENQGSFVDGKISFDAGKNYSFALNDYQVQRYEDQGAFDDGDDPIATYQPTDWGNLNIDYHSGDPVFLNEFRTQINEDNPEGSTGMVFWYNISNDSEDFPPGSWGWSAGKSDDDHFATSHATPLPGAVWALGAGLAGLYGIRKKFA